VKNNTQETLGEWRLVGPSEEKLGNKQKNPQPSELSDTANAGLGDGWRMEEEKKGAGRGLGKQQTPPDGLVWGRATSREGNATQNKEGGALGTSQKEKLSSARKVNFLLNRKGCPVKRGTSSKF